MFEIVEMKRDTKVVLNADLTVEDKFHALRENGFRTMAEDALLKASLGHTSLAEVERIFGNL